MPSQKYHHYHSRRAAKFNILSITLSGKFKCKAATRYAPTPPDPIIMIEKNGFLIKFNVYIFRTDVAEIFIVNLSKNIILSFHMAIYYVKAGLNLGFI